MEGARYVETAKAIRVKIQSSDHTGSVPSPRRSHRSRSHMRNIDKTAVVLMSAIASLLS